jgi:phosphoglycerate dehydrogenase-like enzyme
MTTVLCGVTTALERIRDTFPEVEVIDVSGGIPPGCTGEVLFPGFANMTMDPAEYGVRWVQLPGTGIDAVPGPILQIELVTSARGAGAVPIAEYVLAVMLAWSRRFPEYWIGEPPKHWNVQSTAALAGQHLGLLGFGGIGQRVATLALAFDMKVSAIRRTDAPSPLPAVTMASGLDQLLAESDHLVLCAPGTATTRHLLDDAAFAKVKPGVHLVNIARGSLIDQDALRRALDDGRVARASLDVCEPEPLPAEHWLYEHPKVFLTPHASWTGVEFLGAATDIFCDNLRRYLDHEELFGLIDRNHGY